MAGPSVSRPGPVAQEPGPAVTQFPPIVPDYPLAQTIVNSALPNPKALEKVAAGRQHVLRTAKPGDPIPYAFGRTFVRPVVIGADDTGDYLVLDLMWSVGEIEHLNGISNLGWNYALYFPDIGYKNVSSVLHEHFTGTQGQAASTIMTALKGSYAAYPGIAHSVISMQPGWNLNIVGAVDGVKVIDPRTSPYTTAWTRNPALILADMLVRCGYTMDYSSVADAADYCDELVGSTSPQIERWKISGVINERADLQTWIHTMAQYAHCFVDKSGSTFYLRPDKPRASSHTVTADEMLEGSARLKLRGKRNTVDGVRVTYGFSLRTLDAEYGTLTDPGTTTHLQMPFWAGSFPYQGAHAKRHAEEVYRKSQLEVEDLEFVSFDEGLNRTVGDVGTITNAALGLSSRTMTLIENSQAGPGRWRRRYTDYDATVYQDTSYDLTYNDTEVQNPHFPPDGPTPTAYEETYTDGDGNTYQRFQITFIGQTWAYLKDYWVVVEHDGIPVMQMFVDHIPKTGSPLTEQTHTVYTDVPLIAAEAYNIKVYVRSIVLATSATPGETWITALSVFGNYYELERGLAYITWTNLENMLVDDGSSYATAVWNFDEENETNFAELYEHPAAPNIPDDATIDLIRVDIRAWKSATTSVVNIKSMQMVAGSVSPEIGGSVKGSQAVTTTATVYTFEGDLTYWGLTNAQAQELFDGSGNGWIQFVGECVDTLAITTMTLTVDWVKASVTFTP